MQSIRRRVVLGIAAAAGAATLALSGIVGAQAPKVLKISHQFPASTGEDGDFRTASPRSSPPRSKSTNGQIKIEVYPNGSLVKTFSQFGALRKGTLDMSVLPIAAAARCPRPPSASCPRSSRATTRAFAGKTCADRQGVVEDPRRQGHRDPSRGWQAGGIASKTDPVVSPDDAKEPRRSAAAAGRWTS